MVDVHLMLFDAQTYAQVTSFSFYFGKRSFNINVGELESELYGVSYRAHMRSQPFKNPNCEPIQVLQSAKIAVHDLHKISSPLFERKSNFCLLNQYESLVIIFLSSLSSDLFPGESMNNFSMLKPRRMTQAR